MIRLLTICCFLLPCSARADCYAAAAQRYSVNIDVLWAVAMVESSLNPNAIGIPLKEGDVALGLMQVNTIHLKGLAKYGIKRKDLFNPCTSFALGAWVLSGCIRDVGNTWTALGCYVAGAKSKAVTAQRQYVAKVQRAYAARTASHARGHSTPIFKETRSPTVALAQPSRKMKIWAADE